MNVILPTTPIEVRKQIARDWAADFRIRKTAFNARLAAKPAEIKKSVNIIPYWVEFAELKKKKNIEKQKAQLEAMKKFYPEQLKPFAFAIANGFTYESFTSYHHRVKNTATGKFVDFWTGKNRTFYISTGIKGEQGKNQDKLIAALLELVS